MEKPAETDTLSDIGGSPINGMDLIQASEAPLALLAGGSEPAKLSMHYAKYSGVPGPRFPRAPQAGWLSRPAFAEPGGSACC